MRPVQRIVRRRFERGVRWTEQRLGGAPAYKWVLRYVFPDHWSFLIGEIALYAFLVLIATGIFLTLYYIPSDSQVVYHGSYGLLRDQEMSEAYRSVLDITFNVPAGLLLRQVHHWAADVFIAAIVLHVVRIFFTGAYRKPRDLNYYIGLTMLMLAILEGFAGYSLVDAHLGASRRDHAPAPLPVPGAGRKERNVVGTPLWPAYALRSIGLLLAVAAILVLIGGLIQINPIWQWGPYHPYLAENGAQPDWYIGWLIGALRLMPNFEPVTAGHTIIANPFWGGALFPLVVFGVLFAWPALERRFTGDQRRHDLLDRPRDHPTRTAVGAAFLSWVVIVFAVGSTDRIFYRLHITYTAQIHFWRAGIWVLPMIVFWLTRSACRSLARGDQHPMRGWQGEVVRRRVDGTVEVLAEHPDRTVSLAAEPPVGSPDDR